MQMRNSECIDSVGNKGFFEAIDFPTEEELIAALEDSLEQSPWLPRPVSVALQTTSSDLARHWQELIMTAPNDFAEKSDEHYLAWVSPPLLDQELPVEPDFLASFAKFLTDRLTMRMQEVEQAQRQLQDELARLRG